LVLDADSKAGLAAVQSLGRAGHEVHVLVRNGGSVTESSRWCHAVYRSPINRLSDNAALWLAEIDRQFNFTLIIPATENSLKWIRELDEHDPLRNKAIVPSNHALDSTLDKERTRLLAKELGIPVADSRLLRRGHQPPVAARFPVVLKPVRSYVQVGDQVVLMDVVIARTPLERHRALRTLLPHTDVQEQEWVPGHGVGVEMVFAGGKLVRHFVHERVHELPLTGGASTLRRSAEDEPELVEHSRRILEKLGWHGAAMVEWRRSDDGCFHLMEINPRLWGSLPLTIAAGIDVPCELLAIATRCGPVSPQQWRVGITARNVTGDLGWCIANLRANHTDPLLLTRPRLATLAGWANILTGRERWDGWSFADPKVAIREISNLLNLIASRLTGKFVRPIPGSVSAGQEVRPVSFADDRSGHASEHAKTTGYTAHAGSRNFRVLATRPRQGNGRRPGKPAMLPGEATHPSRISHHSPAS
jgi:hypothetical protein